MNDILDHRVTINHDLSQMHFEHEFKNYDSSEAVELLLKPLAQKFFEQGLIEMAGKVKNCIKTLDANLHNDKLSDKEFRELAFGITKQILVITNRSY